MQISLTHIKQLPGSLILLLVVYISFFTACKKEDREDFLGNYNVLDVCSDGNYQYQMTVIEAGSSGNTINLVGFAEFPGTTFVGTVNNKALTIGEQTVNANGIDVTLGGTGAINGSTLKISYTYTLNGSTNTCTATGTKF